MSLRTFRLKSWTHHERKMPKGHKGLASASFKSHPGSHAVVLVLGALNEDAPLSDEWIIDSLKRLGFEPKGAE